MKIIAKREAILSPLQAVIGVVERRQTMPILANVLLRKTGKRVEFTTSDLEIQVRTPMTWVATRPASTPPSVRAS